MKSTDLLIYEIKTLMPELSISLEEPMSRHCSFRIGGPVAAMAFPSSFDEVEQLCELLRFSGVRPLVMGNGTNLLVTDERLDRVVIKISSNLSNITQYSDTELVAGAGVTLARLANHAQSLGLTGLEFAHGIPGTLGGAVYMNAGAYGGEMKDVVGSTTYLGEDLQIGNLSARGHDFSYRHSVFSDRDCIILASKVSLTPCSPDDIRCAMNQLGQQRRSCQPLDLPSAGSTFKRPPGGYAARLIDEAGLKGCCIGGAQVSPKHAGFVVNRGGATFQDVVRLIEHIQEAVLRSFGVQLEPEVRIIEN